MIRWHDKVFDDYYIDKETGVITKKDGSIVETRLHHPYVVVKGNGELAGLCVHVIQINTWQGYLPNMDVHHIDENKFNNSLSNLIYLSRSNHQKIHTKKRNNFKDQKGENNNMYGVKYKWINNGKESRFLFENEELPQGWKYGRFWKKESLDNIKKSHTGKHHTEDAKLKMSKARKGKKFTELHKQHMREAMKIRLEKYYAAKGK